MRNTALHVISINIAGGGEERESRYETGYHHCLYYIIHVLKARQDVSGVSGLSYFPRMRYGKGRLHILYLINTSDKFISGMDPAGAWLDPHIYAASSSGMKEC